ncbi:hypothetical protein SODALDRAFT_329285 [Sodiomyces alkalinus F11]|uniref:F-box domain-containing protein n=1 Tax=Sodiomyces alkalinus (strain CBS 110278 / VKM F-3762 / F11) TaxID=1314773 RepID=A0A3N2PKT7_SODAK|nr:hypothetical protein SODALDRAFT_329285 [Sodiomyces alkalinus F11]ROT35109.1 hypothetical protein SODALDRAFT_329285 [Sodiomyces alkalinus F11]
MNSPPMSVSDASSASSVADEFLQLTYPSGEPDMPRRKAALVNLVDALGPWELMYLRDLVEARPHGLAGLVQLPQELVSEIATYLGFRDIFTCVRVSKHWRAVWTSDYVVSGYVRYFFPGLIETFAPIQPPNCWNLFRKAARRYIRHQRGKYVTTLAQECDATRLDSPELLPDPISHPNGVLRLPHPPQHIPQARSFVLNSRLFPVHYSHGKVARQLDGCCVILDDLVKRERRLVSSPEARLRGWELVLVAITDKLLVFGDARNNVLVIYHIEYREFRKLSIPSNLMYLYASETTVGFTVFQLDDDTLPEPLPREFRRRPYLWRWGENLLPVDLPRTDPSAARLTSDPKCAHDIGFVFHPWNPDVFFLVYMCAGPGLPEESRAFLQISVSEYHDRTLVRSYHTRHFFDGTQDELVRLKPLCRAMDSHGGVALCLAWLETTSVVMARFNVLTRRFAFCTVPEHPDSSLTGPGHNRRRLEWDESVFFWNNVFYSYRQASRADNAAPYRAVAFAPIGENKRRADDGRGRSRLEIFGERWQRRTLEGGGLDGDDNLLVLGTEIGYYVWNFQDGTDGSGIGWLTPAANELADMPVVM